MGNICCEFFTSLPQDTTHSLPHLLSYKQNDVSTVDYSRFTPTDDDVNELVVSPLDLTKQNSLDRVPPPSNLNNSIVVWLTANTNEDQTSLDYLRRCVHSFRLFLNIEELMAFLVQIKDEKLLLILSDIFARSVISSIHPFSQLMAIYILSNDPSDDEQWINQYEKIQGIFTRMELLCVELKRRIHLSEDHILPIEIIRPSSMIIQYLMKQILLSEIDYPEKLKNELIDFARQEYRNELNVIKEFEETYTPSEAMRWYTRECFLYSAMAKAFRTQNMELLIKIGFFIRDLHQQIYRSDMEAKNVDPIIVYRGQGILENQLETIKTNQNSFFSFKNFLRTTTDRTISLNNTRLARNNPDFLGVLFRVEIRSMLPLMFLENEYLFSIYSLFRIGETKEIEERIWQIDLLIVEDDDQQLKDYRKSIKDMQGHPAWQQLGLYFIQQNQFDQAEELGKILIEFNLINHPKHLAFLNEQLAILYQKKNDSMQSLLYYKKSLKDHLTIRSLDHPNLFPIYLNIGILSHQQHSSTEAIQHFKYALNIALHSSPLDHRQISHLYQHIADVYEEQEMFVDAIQNYQSALENQLNRCPLRPSSLAKTYEKIGQIFYRMEDYTRALSYYTKTLQIQTKSLSPNHAVLANTNYRIAMALDGLQQHKEAIEHASRAVNIARHSFGFNHNYVQFYQEYLNQLRQKTFVNVIPNGAVYE